MLIASVGWALLCALFDLRHRRIPNLLIVIGLAIAITGMALSGAASEWPTHALGVLVATGLTLPGFLWGRLGAGDVKLLITVGLLGGTTAVLMSFIAGSLLSIAFLGWLLLRRRPAAQLPLGGLMALGFIAHLMLAA